MNTLTKTTLILLALSPLCWGYTYPSDLAGWLSQNGYPATSTSVLSDGDHDGLTLLLEYFHDDDPTSGNRNDNYGRIEWSGNHGCPDPVAFPYTFIYTRRSGYNASLMEYHKFTDLNNASVLMTQASSHTDPNGDYLNEVVVSNGNGTETVYLHFRDVNASSGGYGNMHIRMKIKTSYNTTTPVQYMTAGSEPVGVMNTELIGGTDHYLAAPYHKAPAFSGRIIAPFGNVLLIEGPTNWTTDQWANDYYALITSGAKAGMHIPIVGNASNSITLDFYEVTYKDPSGVDQTLRLEDLTGVVGWDTIKIIPYQKVEDVYKMPVDNQSSLIFYDNDLATSAPSGYSLTYYAGYGWYKGLFPADETLLFPNDGYIFRTKSGQPTTNNFVSGFVPLAPSRTYFYPLDDYTNGGIDQEFVFSITSVEDEVIGFITYQLEVSAGYGALVYLMNGHFYDNTIAGINKQPQPENDLSHYWIQGANPLTEGWWEGNYPTGTFVDDTFILKAGQGFRWQFGTTGFTGGTMTFTAKPNYLDDLKVTVSDVLLNQ